MKVIDKSAGHLTNFEVASLLQRQVHERRAAERKMPLPGARRSVSGSCRSLQDVEVITEQATGYLDKAACAAQSREGIARFVEALQRFQLTRAEELMLINSRPRSLVELHLIVEECEERMQEEEMQELLSLCAVLDSPVGEAAAS